MLFEGIVPDCECVLIEFAVSNMRLFEEDDDRLDLGEIIIDDDDVDDEGGEGKLERFTWWSDDEDFFTLKSKTLSSSSSVINCGTIMI